MIEVAKPSLPKFYPGKDKLHFFAPFNLKGVQRVAAICKSSVINNILYLYLTFIKAGSPTFTCDASKDSLIEFNHMVMLG